ADMDRQRNSRRRDPLRPGDNRARIEGELGDDRHFGIAALAKGILPSQRMIDDRRPTAPVDLPVALRMPRHMQPEEAETIEKAGLQHGNRTVESTDRFGNPAAEKQRL